MQIQVLFVCLHILPERLAIVKTVSLRAIDWPDIDCYGLRQHIIAQPNDDHCHFHWCASPVEIDIDHLPFYHHVIPVKTTLFTDLALILAFCLVSLSIPVDTLLECSSPLKSLLDDSLPIDSSLVMGYLVLETTIDIIGSCSPGFLAQRSSTPINQSPYLTFN